MSVDLEFKDHVAIITINNPKQLGALTRDMIVQLGHRMREAASCKDSYITLLTGTGRFFSSYVMLPPCPLQHSTICYLTIGPSHSQRRQYPRRARARQQRGPPTALRAPFRRPPGHRSDLLHAPAHPRRGTQRACRRPGVSPSLARRLHLRRATHVPTGALQLDRHRGRGRRYQLHGAPHGRRPREGGDAHGAEDLARGAAWCGVREWRV